MKLRGQLNLRQIKQKDSKLSDMADRGRRRPLSVREPSAHNQRVSLSVHLVALLTRYWSCGDPNVTARHGDYLRAGDSTVLWLRLNTISQRRPQLRHTIQGIRNAVFC